MKRIVTALILNSTKRILDRNPNYETVDFFPEKTQFRNPESEVLNSA